MELRKGVKEWDGRGWGVRSGHMIRCVGGFWKRGEATGGLGKRVRAHHGRREAERTILCDKGFLKKNHQLYFCRGDSVSTFFM